VKASKELAKLAAEIEKISGAAAFSMCMKETVRSSQQIVVFQCPSL
jgi:hypothetical protein